MKHQRMNLTFYQRFNIICSLNDPWTVPFRNNKFLLLRNLPLNLYESMTNLTTKIFSNKKLLNKGFQISGVQNSILNMVFFFTLSQRFTIDLQMYVTNIVKLKKNIHSIRGVLSLKHTTYISIFKDGFVICIGLLSFFLVGPDNVNSIYLSLFLVSIPQNINPMLNTTLKGLNSSISKIISKPTTYKIPKRYMIKKTAFIAVITGDNIISKETNHLARSTYNLLKTISNENIIEDLNNNKPKSFYKNTLNYVANNTYGNVQMKTNLLSTGITKPMEISDIKNAYNEIYPENRKIVFVDKGIVYTKIFAEIPVIHNHTMTHDSSIKDVLITGDTIKCNSKSNPNPDVFFTLEGPLGIRKTYNDAKSGTAMVKEPLHGTLGQLTYDDGEQISLPNTNIDLLKFNRDRTSILKMRQKEILNNLTDLEKEEFKHCLREADLLTVNGINILHNHIRIEEYLFRIQRLPNCPKALSFINVVHINNEQLISAEELTFIQGVLPHLNQRIFSNPRNLKKYLIEALKVYHERIDHQAILKLSSLKGKQWEYTFLDDIDTTIFTA